MALTSTEEALVRQLIDQQAAILSLAGSESTIISKLGATKVTIADLTSASSIADADLFLIRQGTTEKNVSGAVVKALIPVVADASETVKGIVELATVAEVQAGTDTTRAVTTAGLVGRTSTETRAGLIELATVAEAQALTDAVRALSPARLASAFGGANQSLAASGYQKLPSGLIIQWGTVESQTGNASVTWPITFPSALLNTIAIMNAPNTSDLTHYLVKVVASASTVSSGSFTVQQATANLAITGSYRWIAIGY